ncbi:hypothetical protein KBW81_15090 [Loktanella salsilacus]|uniref:hypothetical protein n=1 Tax=Loktanella salsilacus TaxID=195913 RepID=UPI0020B677B6|nr:hypothetical protein [Loktanella salsilacus]UTH47996.1 hypothetical protein KBW81_15090 [Loktanella salsilacus]
MKHQKSRIVALAVMTALTAPAALADSLTTATATKNQVTTQPVAPMPKGDLVIVGLLAALALAAAN